MLTITVMQEGYDSALRGLQRNPKGKSFPPFLALWGNLDGRAHIYAETLHFQIILGNSFMNVILPYYLLLHGKDFTNL